MIVTLTPDRWAEAEMYGDKRRDMHQKRSGSTHHKDGGCMRVRDRYAAVAEYALAYSLGVLDDWVQTKAYAETARAASLIPCDVGKNLHVRSTDKWNGGLILHGDRRPSKKPDPDHGVFVLAVVVMEDKAVRFPGWILAADGKNDAYWRTDGTWRLQPAYCVPQGALRPMAELPQEAIR